MFCQQCDRRVVSDNADICPCIDLYHSDRGHTDPQSRSLQVRSPATRVFFQQFVHTDIKETQNNALLTILWRESIGDWCIPVTKGRWCGQRFHIMTSSCEKDSGDASIVTWTKGNKNKRKMSLRIITVRSDYIMQPGMINTSKMTYWPLSKYTSHITYVYKLVCYVSILLYIATSTSVTIMVQTWRTHVIAGCWTRLVLSSIQVRPSAVKVRALPGPHPTSDISIEFEIRPEFEVLWFDM